MPEIKKKSMSLDDMIAKKRRLDASKVASMIMGKKRNETVVGAPTKPRAVSGNGVTGKPMPNTRPSINKAWTHDLHHKNNPNESRVSKLPTTLSPTVARSLQNNRLFAALHTDQVKIAVPSSTEHLNGSAGRNLNPGRGSDIRGVSKGFSIRGSAGPVVVQASNFAPGTTAEDIKHAMMPLGKILSCIILTAVPTVICEIVFEKKDSAEKCIDQYNGQRADGRVLHMFFKNGPPVGRVANTQMHQTHQMPSDPYAQREEADRLRREANVTFHDGRYGVTPPPLYSDALMQKGRGFSRG
ncbi:hypothetical protein EDC01DRAFT_664605 [Geopyxis carbonaria]|nr:hypothetical protein EDC01DRAFT_664605 [Geopyxis carbonaria]